MFKLFLSVITFFKKLNIADRLTRCIKAAAHFAVFAATKLSQLASKAAHYAVEAFRAVKGFRPRVTPKVLSACISLSICLFVGAVAACHTGAVAVVVNGKTVGYVKSAEEAEAAGQLVYSSLEGGSYDLADIEYKNSFIIRSEIGSAAETAESALESIEGIEKKCGLYVDGMLTAVADSRDTMQSMIDTLVASFEGDGLVFDGFSNTVAVNDIYVPIGQPLELASTAEQFLNGMSGIMVKTCRTETFEQEMPYETEITYDLTKIKGYSRIIEEGKNGLNLVTAEVTYINGERFSSDVKSSIVLEEPKNASAVAGMCDEAIAEIKTTFDAADVAEGSAEQLMTFPCERTEKTYISSYWGDDRDHQGMDIASPYGSAIYAAADGKVTYVGWKNGYGQCVIIDHLDGKTQTIYSHCSELLAEKGQTVSAGDHIAKVGSTGNSTGNHLHFAILINDSFVDPAAYLGIENP